MRRAGDDDELAVVFGELADFILRVAAIVGDHFDFFRRDAEQAAVVPCVREAEFLWKILLEILWDGKGDGDRVVDAKLLQFMGDAGRFEHAGGHDGLEAVRRRKRLVENVAVAEDGDDVGRAVGQFLCDMERLAFVFELHRRIPSVHGIEEEKKRRDDDSDFSYQLGMRELQPFCMDEEQARREQRQRERNRKEEGGEQFFHGWRLCLWQK